MGICTVLLITPLILMQLTDEVQWKPGDFLVAAVLIFGTAIACELVLIKIAKVSLRVIICIGIVLLALFVWAELAVGLI